MTLRILTAVLAGSVLAAGQVRKPEAPLTVEQAVEEALAHNLNLTAERLSLQVIETRELTARLRPNPVLTVSGQTLNVLGAKYSPDTPLGPNQWNAHMELPLERGHKREERMAVAREDRTLAGLNLRETMRRVIAEVQRDYVDVQQAREDLELAQENLKSLEGVVAVNEVRVKNGDLAAVELERSRLAALQYTAAVRQAELELAQAKTRLLLAMGRRDSSRAFEVSEEMRRDELKTTPEELAKLALERRPDYRAGEQAQARSRADLKLQRANGKVDYTVGTEYTHQSAWGVSGNSMGVYFSMPLPVFNRNQGEVARAQREIGLAAARVKALEAEIGTEAEQAYRQSLVSRQLLERIETEMLGRARAVRDITEYSYRRGEASLVEFLDAQRAYNDATMTYNEARANYARSLYQMDAVSGAILNGR